MNLSLMTDTEMILKAATIAHKAHAGQVDKGGNPYFTHPLAVAMLVAQAGGPSAAVVAALLHDVVEDTATTVEDLEAAGFGREVTDAISLLTHDKSVPYMDYVASISNNPIARAVKIADLTNNSDLTRIPSPTDADLRRVEKYRAALDFLNGKA